MLPEKCLDCVYIRQPVYPEPLGGSLLPHAIVAEVELAVSQLFNLEEPGQAVGKAAHLFLLLRPSLQPVRYVQRKILERLVGLGICTAVHAMDLREETRSIIRPRFSQEENEQNDFPKDCSFEKHASTRRRPNASQKYIERLKLLPETTR